MARKGKRIQKWLDLDDAVYHIVSNGRFSAFKALLKTDLVEDRDVFYRRYFNADLVDDEYKVFYRNKPYVKYSEEICEASPRLVDVISNKSGNKIMLSLRKSRITKIDMRHEPFVWRSSLFLKWLEQKRRRWSWLVLRIQWGTSKKRESKKVMLTV